MDSRFFDLDLPYDVKEMVADKAANMRIRFPGRFSKHNPIFRKERNQQICRKINEGATIQEITEQYRLTEQWIRKILRDNNIRYCENKQQSRIEDIKLLIKMGCKNKAEIAKKLEISRPTVYRIMRKEGLE